MTVQLDSPVARNDSILFSELDDKLLMMSIDNGEYYSLDAIGAHIWTLLAEPISVAALCEALVNEFDVAPETCREDVLAFMNELFALEVITILNDRR